MTVRKLSELLPLVRQHLRTATKDGDIFVCYALNKVTNPLDHEGRSFSDAIYQEMARQSPNGWEPAYLYELLLQSPRGNEPMFLYELLRELGTIPDTMNASNLAYIPHRDAWLDAWQAKLEGEGL
jgi:hypothetical protein